MQLNERFKKFPVKFYKNIDNNKIEYESGFTQGTASSLEDAFKEFSRKDFIHDLLYYYDDVVDIEFGSFEPSLTDKVKNGKQYLGQLKIRLDLSDNWKDSEQSVAYLSKHKEEIPKHLQYIKRLKREEAFDKIKEKVKNWFNNIMNVFRHKDLYEFFDPRKTTTQLICKHCNTIIPVANYYDTYKNQEYHLECLWDKLINKIPENSYKEARKFFFSLQKYISDWPAFGYDNEDDYLQDLDLVRSNDRHNKVNEDLQRTNKILESYLKD